jgi:DNA repair protein RadC
MRQVDEPSHDAAGHRARLRRRLLDGGSEALLDHELIEYLLALAIPRRDTKPLARRLLGQFGTLPRLLEADPAALARIGGIGEGAIAALKIVQAASLRMLRTRVSEAPVLSAWQSLLDYLHADMAHAQIERVRVLHLDTKNRLLRDELISEGSIDQAAVHVREVIRRAIDLGSSALILVHNHPSGDPAPSRQDIALTREIVDAGRPLGIRVHDHVIVGAGGHSSLRALGLI